LDEPTSQLDPQGAEQVMAALQRLVHDHGVTVVLAEHRLDRVAGWADIALGFDHGDVRVGAPADVIASLPGAPSVTRLGRLLGWEPLPLTVRDARNRLGRSNGSIGRPIPARLTPGPPVVVVRDLGARYGPTQVLHAVEFVIGQGEIVAVMGRNGAGKSTLLRAIAGVHTPASGEVSISGHAPRPGIDAALCPQEPESVLFTDRVDREVAATLKALGRAHGATSTFLERLGVESLSERHPRDLSAGQRLLVATAAIAAADAPVLLLDEPTRGLDPASKHRLVRFARDRAGEGAVTVVATHDVELAAAMATRIVMLAGGEVVADGHPADVLGDSQVFSPQMTRVVGPGWLTPEQVAEAMR
jgi:energy-coupling factor transport system ATP-binding protein